jgi:hypothetical protein
LSLTAGACSIDVAANFTAGGSSTSTTPGAGGGVGAATADVQSPLAGSLIVHVACPGVTLADLTVAVDLGETSAEAAFS